MDIIKHGPIVSSDIIPENLASDNINGPCVFRRPEFISLVSEKYIMLFSHHKGNSIRIAVSDSPIKNWKVLPNIFLPISELPTIIDHVASPEVIIHDNHLEIWVHGVIQGKGQQTIKCESQDLISFTSSGEVIAPFYARQIKRNNSIYVLAKNKNIGGILKYGLETQEILPNMRHACYDDKSDTVWYSKIGDRPERIYKSPFGEWEQQECVVMPDNDFEIANKHEPSRPGSRTGNTELRDPFIFNDEGPKYLYYTYRGEEGIACATIT